MATATITYRAAAPRIRELMRSSAAADTRAASHREILELLEDRLVTASAPVHSITFDVYAQEIARHREATREMARSADIWMDEATELAAEAGISPEELGTR